MKKRYLFVLSLVGFLGLTSCASEITAEEFQAEMDALEDNKEYKTLRSVSTAKSNGEVVSNGTTVTNNSEQKSELIVDTREEGSYYFYSYEQATQGSESSTIIKEMYAEGDGYVFVVDNGGDVSAKTLGKEEAEASITAALSANVSNNFVASSLASLELDDVVYKKSSSGYIIEGSLDYAAIMGDILGATGDAKVSVKIETNEFGYVTKTEMIGNDMTISVSSMGVSMTMTMDIDGRMENTYDGNVNTSHKIDR